MNDTDEPRNAAATVYIVSPAAAARIELGRAVKELGFINHPVIDAREFCRQFHEMSPGLILVSAEDPAEGISLIRELRVARCLWPVAAFSSLPSIPGAVAAVRSGAYDYLVLPADPDALAAVLRNGVSLLPAAVEETLSRIRARDLVRSLSLRQAQVLEGITLGLSNKEIARKFDLSPRTIDGYRAAVARKLGTKSAFDMMSIRSLASCAASRLEETAAETG